MAAHLVRLKLALLRGGLRRSVWQVVSLVLAAVWGGVVALMGAVGLALLRGADTALAVDAVVAAIGLLVLGWTVIPLLLGGVDATLDPARFATFAVPLRQLVAGLLLAGLVGVPAVLTVVVQLGALIALSRGPLAALLGLVALPLALLTGVAGSRLLTTAMAGVLRRRRARELGAGAGVVVMMFGGVLLQLLVREFDEPERLLHQLATVLGWSPFGLAWAAAGDAAAGHPSTAAVRLVLAVAVLLVALALWAKALGEQLVTPASSGPARAVAGGTRLDRLLPSTPAGAVAGRCLRYWRRDSRYLTALVTILLLPVLLLAMGVLEIVPLGLGLLWLGPVMAAALAWGLHNDVAFDGPAAWMHVAAGLRGVDDRVGRSVALLVWGAPLTVVACVLGAAWSRPELTPAVLGAAAGLLLGGLGVSAVMSAAIAYPVPEAGQNPFASPPGAGTRTLAGQMVSSLATFAVALPALVPAVLAQLLDAEWLGWLAVLLGAGAGTVALVGGCRVGGRLLDRRWPELLGQVRAAR